MNKKLRILTLISITLMIVSLFPIMVTTGTGDTNSSSSESILTNKNKFNNLGMVVDTDQQNIAKKHGSVFKDHRSSSFPSMENNDGKIDDQVSNNELAKKEGNMVKSTNTDDSDISTSSVNGIGFISTWNTSLGSGDSITLPLESSGSYDFTVDWGDGNSSYIVTSNYTSANHNYASGGVYTLNITGVIEGWTFNNGGDKLKIIEISQWGDLNFGNSGSYFEGTSNLQLTTTDAPDLTGTTDLVGAFMNSGISTGGNLNSWDTSGATDMSFMFNGASSFNQTLNSWNVSNVQRTAYMFRNAISFDQDLSNWDTSSITDMDFMFSDAISFNQPLDLWDVSSVTTMHRMLQNASSFNSSLENWNLSSQDITWLLKDASSFNQPLENWDVSRITSFYQLFTGASSFNQPLDSWNTSSVTDMGRMFDSASSFNQPLDSWNTSGVTDMSFMFNGAASFNQDISFWDFGSVNYLFGFFSNAGLSIDNYDALLKALENQILTASLQMDVSSQYSRIGDYYRQRLIDNGWTVNDDGKDTTFTSTSWFVSTWDTSLGTGASISLPLQSDGTYDFIVSWGDSNTSHITSNSASHTFNSEGTYEIVISGVIEGFAFGISGDDPEKITQISQWGSLKIGNYSYYFYKTSNLQLTTTEALDLTGTTTLWGAFQDSGISTGGNLNSWDTSNITNMRDVFSGASDFNQPLDNWDTSSVIKMNGMFDGSSSFNQPLDNWNVSGVTTMAFMFDGASTFNQTLNSWDVSSVQRTAYMFRNAISFNQNLSNWDISSVSDMEFMFSDAISFNQPLDLWDVSSVSDMTNLFQNASSFNSSLENWNLSSSDISWMFYKAISFDQPLDSWDVSGVTSFYRLFSGATSFDQDLSNWNVSSVTTMRFMFSGVTLSTINYDALLQGWSQLNLQSNVEFDAGNSMYTNVSTITSALDILVNTYNWVITDGGGISDTISPDVSSPTNQTYTEGETGNEFQWTLGDRYPGTYKIERDGTIIVSETSWSNGSVIVDIDGLDVGNYSFTIFVYDEAGNLVQDVVNVEVKKDHGPEISSPADFSYELGSTNNTIEWTLGDKDPNTYSVTRNSTLIVNSTSWSNGTISAINIDGLDLGLYYFTINATDLLGNYNLDTIIVTVVDTTAPTISVTIGNSTVELGSSTTISYNISDLSGTGKYEFFVNGTSEKTGSWQSGLLNYTASPSQLGIFNVTAVVIDANGNDISIEIMVTVEDTTDPSITSSPSDLNFEEGTTGNILTWQVSDLAAGQVEIVINGSIVVTENWSSGSYTYNVSGLSVGIYQLSAIFSDTSGNSVSDNVVITVQAPDNGEVTDDQSEETEGGFLGLSAIVLILSAFISLVSISVIRRQKH